MARVSVVTGVRDGEDYLEEAIDSVLGQGVPVQYIVVDDGSTDRSADIAASYGDRLTLVRQPALGIGAALNRGVGLAQAPWLAFLDADDVWLPDKLERQLAIVDADPEIDILFGACVEFASGAAAVAGAPWKVRTTPQPGHYVGGVLARTELFQRAGFDEQLRLGHFTDLIARLREAGAREVSTDDVVVRRRVHGKNYTILNGASLADFAIVARRALQRRRQAQEGGI